MQIKFVAKVVNFLKHYWWVFLILLFPIFILICITIIHNEPKYSDNETTDTPVNNQTDNNEQEIDKKYLPEAIDCPAELSGVLEYPFMPPEAISFLTPLGNINPPGHGTPIDHIYFDFLTKDKIPLYSPSNAIIINIVEESEKSDNGEYLPYGYSISFLICKGIVLDLTTYFEISPRLQDELKNITPSCNYENNKVGHEKEMGSCIYDTKIKVTSGELIGYTQAKEGMFTFEVWAANYNVPERTDINWEYSNDERYKHAMCLFDLYQGSLKDKYFSKFGIYLSQEEKIIDGKTVIIPTNFIPRTVEPICGEIFQDKVGTIQGVWFSGSPGDTGLDGLAIVHYNIDPTIGILSMGKNVISEYGIIMFYPTHSGRINREPSEITADGKIYCYSSDYPDEKRLDQYRVTGKALIQLMNDHSLKIEYQNGKCLSNESFINPINYQR